jgi:hypothetical protein
VRLLILPPSLKDKNMIKFIRVFQGRITKERLYPIGFVTEFDDDTEDILVNIEKAAVYVKEKKQKEEEDAR